jgi:hypothetical protein
VAELMVFYREQSSGFASDLCYQDESYLDALVRMFEQALVVATTCQPAAGDPLGARLGRVSTTGHKCGYGVGDHMNSSLTETHHWSCQETPGSEAQLRSRTHHYENDFTSVRRSIGFMAT